MSLNQTPPYSAIDADSKTTASCAARCKTVKRPSVNCSVVAICVTIGVGIVVAASIIFAQASNTSHVNVGQVIHMSDFHLDSYYDPRLSIKECRCHWKPLTSSQHCTPATSTSKSGDYGSFGCDSPPSLIQSALAAAAAIAPETDSTRLLPVLVTGDYTRHATHDYQNPSKIVYDAIHNVSVWMKQAGFSSVVSTWGNDDFSKNYYLNTSQTCKQQTSLKTTIPSPSNLLKITAETLSMNLHAHEKSNVFSSHSMECYGYYAYDVFPGIRVLSLNTIVYSVKHTPKDLTNVDPMDQFKWLRSELNKCVSDVDCHAIWIIGHIPPGREWCQGVPSWDNVYVEQYVSILSDYSNSDTHGTSSKSIIKGQLFGHEHINSVRLIDRNPNIPPIVIAAAVSPVYGNRPSFRTIDYIRDRINHGTIVNVHVHGKTLNGDGGGGGGGGGGMGSDMSWKPRFSMISEFNLVDKKGTPVLSTESIGHLFDTFAYNEDTKTMNPPFQTFVTRSWDRDSKLPPDTSPCITHPNVCHLQYALDKDIDECIKKKGRK